MHVRDGLATVLIVLATVVLVPATVANATAADEPVAAAVTDRPFSIVVRTTENVTRGGWVWLLNQARESGIRRIDLLVKQDEDGFESARTGRTLESGQLLVALPGEATAAGWEDSTWLHEMLDRAHAFDIEVWAWFPVFRDAVAARQFPQDREVNESGEVFVDAASPGGQQYERKILRKLLEAYPFDGVSLDWIRYDGWSGGSAGPLAADFRARTGREPSSEVLRDPSARSEWFEIRARAVERFVADVASEIRAARPHVGTGAFLLPLGFPEVSQDYRLLARAGVDYLQTMAYWDDWDHPPEWVGAAFPSEPGWLGAGSAWWPVLDLENDDADIVRAVRSLPEDRVAGVGWFVFGEWTAGHFEKLKRARAAWTSELLADRKPPPRPKRDVRLPIVLPASFPEEASVWALVCLAELHRRDALDAAAGVVPVLAFHEFQEGPVGGGSDIWTNSTSYLDGLFGFLKRTGFEVIPLSRLVAYIEFGDSALLPSLPVVLTTDDGSRSVLTELLPRAIDHDAPFSVALITSRLADEGEARYVAEEDGRSDPSLDWADVSTMDETGLVEWVSHSAEAHTWEPLDESDENAAPSLLARTYQPKWGRRETRAEHRTRIYGDLLESRREIAWGVGDPPLILAWPYGEFDAEALAAARAAGFRNFLLYAAPALARFGPDPEDIPRLSVTRADEAVPLAFPDDEALAQRWWLAFLDIAVQSRSAELIEATLAQLDGRVAAQPVAESARVAVDLLRGHEVRARARARALLAAWPHDPDLASGLRQLLGD